MVIIKRSSLCALFLFVLIVSGPGCKKDKKSKSKTELLTTGSWQISSYTVSPGQDWDFDGDIDTDIYAIMDACVTDDRTTFNSNGTGVLDEGVSKCDPGDPDNYDLDWSFAQNETVLMIDGEQYNILSLTESQLQVTQIEQDPPTTYTHTVTFTH